ncbi:MAG: zinc-ribbon domain-containing protein [Candidatus Helarchaeota archaeon]
MTRRREKGEPGEKAAGSTWNESCPSCGKRVYPGDIFCGNCGYQLRPDEWP